MEVKRNAQLSNECQFRYNLQHLSHLRSRAVEMGFDFKALMETANQARQLEIQIQRQTITIDSLTKEVCSREREVAHLNCVVRDQEARSRERDSRLATDHVLQQLAHKKVSIENLHKIVQDKNVHIQSLFQKTLDKEENMQILRGEIVDKNGIIKQLRFLLAQKEQRLRDMEALVKQNNDKILELEAEIGRLSSICSQEKDERELDEGDSSDEKTGERAPQPKFSSGDMEMLQDQLYQEKDENNQLRASLNMKTMQNKQLREVVQCKNVRVERLRILLAQRDRDMRSMYGNINEKYLDFERMRDLAASSLRAALNAGCADEGEDPDVDSESDAEEPQAKRLRTAAPQQKGAEEEPDSLKCTEQEIDESSAEDLKDVQ